MFCPACAAALEPGAAACPNCGEPVLAGKPVPQPAPVLPMNPTGLPSAVPGMPSAVRRAVTLLWLAVGISIFTLAVTMIELQGRLLQIPRFIAPIALVLILWIVAVVLTTRRHNAGRFLVFLLVAYSAFILLVRFRMLIVHANPGALVALVELALRGYAVWLLLRPESSAWFSGSSGFSGSSANEPRPFS